MTLLPSCLHHPHDPREEEAEEGDDAAWGEEQAAALVTTASVTATAHMAGAYLRLAQSCGNLRALSLPRQR